MSLKGIRHYEAVCDGCGTRSVFTTGDRSEARERARLQGWTFPPMLCRNGEQMPYPSRKRSHSVCGACTEGWELRFSDSDTWGARRDEDGKPIVSAEQRAWMSTMTMQWQARKRADRAGP